MQTQEHVHGFRHDLLVWLMPVPSPMEAPSGEGGTVPGEQMGRNSSSWDTMYDHHTGLLSAAVSKWPLGLVVSVLRGAPNLAGAERGQAEVAGCAPISGESSGFLGPRGNASSCGAPWGSSKAEPWSSPFSSVQAEVSSAT